MVEVDAERFKLDQRRVSHGCGHDHRVRLAPLTQLMLRAGGDLSDLQAAEKFPRRPCCRVRADVHWSHISATIPVPADWAEC